MRAIPGRVKLVAADGRHIVLETADGTEEKIDVAAHPVSRHVKDSGDKAGKGMTDLPTIGAKEAEKGADAIVHYSEKAWKKTVDAVTLGFDQAVKTSKVVVQKVDQEGRRLKVKTKEGVEEVYDAAERTTVAGGDEAVEFGEWVGDKSREGAEVTVHYVEKSGKKVVHGLEYFEDSLQ